MAPPALRLSPKIVFAAATALGLFSTFQAYNYLSLFTDREPSFLTLLFNNVLYWYAWAVLVPAIVWLARRFRFDRRTWRAAVAVHVPGVLAFTFAHAALYVSVQAPLLNQQGREADWWPIFRELFFRNFDWEMMTYWAVVGLSHALDYHRAAQDQAIAAAQLETKLAEARLQALERQLHPHFLFNTLHSISALIHRDPEGADAMLAQLSDLLRLTLDRVGTQEVTLKEELDFLEKYIEIERRRFGDRLRVHLQIEPATLDAAVPTLLLQPLVENAIRHGIAQQVGGGRVDITARREDGTLELVVRDTGPGLSPAKRHALHTGVGLTNTRSRLQHLFGGAHCFEFQEPPGGGLSVRVVIPFTLAPRSRVPGTPVETLA